MADSESENPDSYSSFLVTICLSGAVSEIFAYVTDRRTDNADHYCTWPLHCGGPGQLIIIEILVSTGVTSLLSKSSLVMVRNTAFWCYFNCAAARQQYAVQYKRALSVHYLHIVMMWRCQLANEFIDDLGPFFKRLQLLRLPGGESHKTGNSRHDPAWQQARRRHLALSRNRLLSAALSTVSNNVNWVLWMDSDIRHIPRDLIRLLLSANQSIVVSNCLWRQANGQVCASLAGMFIL